ncbi:MAG: hypothetical protein NC453_12310 [Muribaculum sp.]|nr:hypothetical protein [Muribaculum sp.]
MNRSEIHVVNKHGEKKVMSRKEYNIRQKSINGDYKSDYVFDVDWYLSHGCITLEQMIEDIENGTTAE